MAGPTGNCCPPSSLFSHNLPCLPYIKGRPEKRKEEKKKTEHKGTEGWNAMGPAVPGGPWSLPSPDASQRPRTPHKRAEAGTSSAPTRHSSPGVLPLIPRRYGKGSGKSRRRRAYPQQIVTTRLLYCLQDPFAQLSRLQRI